MFVLEAMFAILKGLEIFSIPDMPLQYYLLLGGLTCLGVAIISFVLKSYFLTYDIASVIRTVVSRSYDPSSVSLTYR